LELLANISRVLCFRFSWNNHDNSEFIAFEEENKFIGGTNESYSRYRTAVASLNMKFKMSSV